MEEVQPVAQSMVATPKETDAFAAAVEATDEDGGQEEETADDTEAAAPSE
jgi:hypothetical protein